MDCIAICPCSENFDDSENINGNPGRDVPVIDAERKGKDFGRRDGINVPAV